jgi:hypothetical protein
MASPASLLAEVCAASDKQALEVTEAGAAKLVSRLTGWIIVKFLNADVPEYASRSSIRVSGDYQSDA